MTILRKLLVILILAGAMVTASGCLSIKAEKHNGDKDEIREVDRDRGYDRY